MRRRGCREPHADAHRTRAGVHGAGCKERRGMLLPARKGRGEEEKKGKRGGQTADQPYNTEHERTPASTPQPPPALYNQHVYAYLTGEEESGCIPQRTRSITRYMSLVSSTFREQRVVIILHINHYFLSYFRARPCLGTYK